MPLLCHKKTILLGGLIMQSVSAAHAENLPVSTNIYGSLGLNTIPSARMDKTGTIRAGISTLDPYAHLWASAQIAKPLSIVLRQSAEVSNINEDADRLYPGVDFKLRLLTENHIRPELSIGLQSAIGHKRMAGEYIAASKRYKNFDFTVGLGWGRFATAKHFKNPLKALHSHFGKNRSLDGEMPNEPANWFTGSHIGAFAGLEYFTPLDGLSLKLDYGADRYTAESTALDFNAPAPWSVGLNYKPADWVNLGIAAQGTDKLMARLSFQGNVKNWKKQSAQEKAAPLRPYRTGIAFPAEMKLSAEQYNQNLYTLNADENNVRTNLSLRSHLSTPYQIGQAATHIANHAGPTIEKISIRPTIMGLKGPEISLMRRDLEMAKAKNNGSAEEIWHNASFNDDNALTLLPSTAQKRAGQLNTENIHLTLDNQFSLSEEDHGTLYRTSLAASWHSSNKNGKPVFFGLVDIGTSVRLNIKDNLNKLKKFRPRALLPVRSNEDRFAARTIGLDTQYLSFTHSFTPNAHMSLLGGYLEEMYAGAGGELLYRPYNARWAIGAESWLALKRDPETALNLGLNGDHLLTANINGWYDVPDLGVTLHGKVGRFLAADTGATIALQKRFDNGAQLEGFVSISDMADFDLFGGTTHAYHGVRLSLPLSGYKYMPKNSHINIKAAPFGRDIAQGLNSPLPLYDLTEKFNTRHISAHWNEITKP